ncbi:gp14 [Corynebacterium phage BFK20]|uniref:Gp14 n=1 Tax=Corynebacterium phage BFK20 TaxID=28358 RepID=Q9MBJ0_9CAUD|nr:gp14 [Corynebacterium phage BFK20]CAB93920.2 gp14 [Corynebacterium phage BFK20]
MPPDNAITRALNDGKSWTMDNAIAWTALGKLTEIEKYWRARLNIKTRPEKWPETPWDQNTGSGKVKRHGQVAEEDRQDAVDYLLTMIPLPA